MSTTMPPCPSPSRREPSGTRRGRKVACRRCPSRSLRLPGRPGARNGRPNDERLRKPGEGVEDLVVEDPPTEIAPFPSRTSCAPRCAYGIEGVKSHEHPRRLHVLDEVEEGFCRREGRLVQGLAPRSDAKGERHGLIRARDSHPVSGPKLRQRLRQGRSQRVEKSVAPDRLGVVPLGGRKGPSLPLDLSPSHSRARRVFFQSSFVATERTAGFPNSLRHSARLRRRRPRSSSARCGTTKPSGPPRREGSRADREKASPWAARLKSKQPPHHPVPPAPAPRPPPLPPRPERRRQSPGRQGPDTPPLRAPPQTIGEFP